MTLDRRHALRFVVLLGFVSLLADVTYEGARSATGPFLATLGATALMVSLVSGGGELVGYTLRFWSGRLADRTRRYWLITSVGYAVNLLAVPLLALAGHWQVAAALILLERTGKALRTPARDAMLSYATQSTGRGWGFGLHEAMDQVGATVGPLIVAGVVMQSGDYRRGFALLLLPAMAALAMLALARREYPDPRALERVEVPIAASGYSTRYWVYLAGTGLVAAGYADYPLLAYHFDRAGLFPPAWIPALYGCAMAVDAVAALAFGRWFDRAGVRVLVLSTLISSAFAPLAFGHRPALAVVGVALWGIGMGAQESIMRAAIAEMTPADRRATAYGLFNLVYGIAWFAGSVVLGLAYQRSLGALITFSVASQLAGAACLVASARRQQREATSG